MNSRAVPMKFKVTFQELGTGAVGVGFGPSGTIGSGARYRAGHLAMPLMV